MYFQRGISCRIVLGFGRGQLRYFAVFAELSVELIDGFDEDTSRDYVTIPLKEGVYRAFGEFIPCSPVNQVRTGLTGCPVPGGTLVDSIVIGLYGELYRSHKIGGGIGFEDVGVATEVALHSDY